MDIRQLKIFRDIAIEKNFVKAAYLNYLTQPSISVCLKQLEEDLGIRLFERAPRKVSLTREGEILLPRVEELLRQFDNLSSFASQMKNIQKGDVRIATIHSIGIYELTPTLKKFMRAYPDIKVHLQYRPAPAIYDLVQRNEVDLGLVAYPKEHPKINIQLFSKDTMVVITPPQHPLARRKSILLKDIEGEPFIAFDQNVPTRKAVDSLLVRNKISVAIRTINENIDTLKMAVVVGLGVSIVPSKTVVDEVQKGSLKALKIKDMVLERPLGILTIKNQKLDQSVKLFVDTLMENGGTQIHRR